MATAVNNNRFKVQLAPDGRRFEVIEPATLYLYGSFWSREDAQAHADSLAQAA